MKNPRLDHLCKAFNRLNSAGGIQLFLEDLCTPAEIEAMADRWHVCKLLESGLSYRKINEMTGVSTATITRVARCLTHGNGGYRKALPKNLKE
jgi:TrpR-related protein YerC/YecD